MCNVEITVITRTSTNMAEPESLISLNTDSLTVIAVKSISLPIRPFKFENRFKNAHLIYLNV